MKEKETHCLNPSCGKLLKHTKGRRPKKYCSPSCRNAHYKTVYDVVKPNSREKEMMKLLKEDMANFGFYIYKTEESGMRRVDPLSMEAVNIIGLHRNGGVQSKTVEGAKDEFKKIVESKTNSGLVVEFKAADEKMYDMEKPKVPIKDEYPKTQEVNTENKEKIARILELEKELKNPPKNPLIGLRAWIKVRETEINQLKQQMV